MKTKKNILNIRTIVILMFLLVMGTGGRPSLAARNIKLLVNGRDITSISAPIIKDDRTLVQVRFVSEELGAKVTWNNSDRTVKIEKDNNTVILRIDSHLIKQLGNKESYFLSDVTPVIIGDRTYVPLRLVSNILGVEVNWDNANRTVGVDSSIKTDFTSFFGEKISTINPGQAINGKTDLQITSSNNMPKNGAEIKYLLLDPETSKGKIIARGSNLTDKYTWTPHLKDNGKKVIVAAIYDSKGKFLSGDSTFVNVNVIPKVSLTGLNEGQVFHDKISLGVDVNFVASYVKYEIVNLDKDKTTLTTQQDPWGTYNLAPSVGESGNYRIKVIAYDENDKAYNSQSVNIKLDIPLRLGLSGVTSGMTINKPVTLLATRNFDVSETEYVLRDPKTGAEEVIKKLPYGGYKWFPGPGYSGPREIFVRVKAQGRTHQSTGIPVTLSGRPYLILEGVGPKQVITSEVKIKTINNIELKSVDYVLTNPAKGLRKVIGSKQDPSVEFKYIPTTDHQNYTHIKAVGIYNGKTVESEEIPIKIYLGKIYGPQPIIQKDKFLGLASNLAKESWKNTGMSAALQTAQAILETGWGQSVPVDKYTGKISNNLFGIKGKGTNGSVISNTWEEYNGTTFRIDAEFRAYKNINEGWNSHKEFLLAGQRYGIVREVMHDSSQAAWALRRAGYATDSLYAIKLMNIIKQYNLEELDKVGI